MITSSYISGAVFLFHNKNSVLYHWISLTFPHIHIPMVWGRTEGPTPNPSCLPMSWLSKKDFPE